MDMNKLIEKPPKALFGLLWGASRLYKAGVSLRHVLYDLKWLKCARAQAKVVSVGNIVCGGVGKTPLVKLLAEQISKTKKVAILTRGYRSLAEKRGGTLVLKGPKLPSVEECGDEPYLLASALKDVSIYVGADRVATAKQAATAGHEVLLLDDGMQHRRLFRDFECVVLDGNDLFARGHFLPFGRLRETPLRLKGADILFVNHVQSEEQFKQIKTALKKFTHAPVVGMGYKINKQEKEKVGLFCALGTPKQFVKSVEESGLEVVAEQFALDHRPFDLKELSSFAAKCKKLGCQKLICTEKDSVKLKQLDKLCLPVEVAQCELEIRFGKESFKTFLNELVR